MDQLFSKKCPLTREPCNPDCAVLVEHSTPGMDFGYCGLLGSLLNENITGMAISPTGQRIYPSFFNVTTEKEPPHDQR